LKAVRGKTLDFQTPLPSILQSITFQDAENEFAISRGSPTNQNLYLRRGPPPCPAARSDLDRKNKAPNLARKRPLSDFRYWDRREIFHGSQALKMCFSENHYFCWTDLH